VIGGCVGVAPLGDVAPAIVKASDGSGVVVGVREAGEIVGVRDGVGLGGSARAPPHAVTSNAKTNTAVSLIANKRIGRRICSRIL
jgi:hypothetical protein